MSTKIVSGMFWWCKSDFRGHQDTSDEFLAVLEWFNRLRNWFEFSPRLEVDLRSFCIIKTLQKWFSWTSRHFWWFFGGFGWFFGGFGVIFTCFCSSIATTRAYYHSGGDFSHLRDRKNARKQGLRFCIRFAVDREGGLDCDFEISWKNWLFVFLELKSVKWPHDN